MYKTEMLPPLASRSSSPILYELLYAGASQYFSVFPSILWEWTVAHQAPLSMGILLARILEWILSW